MGDDPPVILDGKHLTLDTVARVARHPTQPVTLTPEAVDRVIRARAVVNHLLERNAVAYGITTGFGHFANVTISPHDAAQLQRNILMSHAVGTGPALPAAVVRAMILIRANTLAAGYSGVRLPTLQACLDLLNRNVVPVVPAQGSLGASGDLAPLAHLALVLIGEGEAWFNGECLPGGEALRRAGLSPVILAAKEGLALTNGTAGMCAIGSLTTVDAESLARVADIASALSLEALHGTSAAFDPRIHQARPHPRQIACADYLRQLLAGSQFLRDAAIGYRPEVPGDRFQAASPASPPATVPATDFSLPYTPPPPPLPQDAYTLRCIPQVHGAARDAIAYARWALEIELNSAVDNPLIFVDDEAGQATPSPAGDARQVGDLSYTVLSGGNFHGEPIAFAMDFLKIALTEIGNISERRLARLTDDASNLGTLPPFLIQHGGVNSGFMLVQYTAAALASENKVLAHPASVDTIPTSANTEDHVSNGMTAARQAQTILENVTTIVACELFAAAQGIDFRRQVLGKDARLGRGTGVAYQLIRERVPFLEQDAIMYPYIAAVRELIVSGELTQAVETALNLSGVNR